MLTCYVYECLKYLCPLCVVVNYLLHNLVLPRFVIVSHQKPFSPEWLRELMAKLEAIRPPPPEPSMAQVLRLMLEEREAARTERQAILATLQHLAQIATNNNNNGGNGNDKPQNKLRDF
jgi:hypothetical protein